MLKTLNFFKLKSEGVYVFALCIIWMSIDLNLMCQEMFSSFMCHKQGQAGQSENLN